MELSKKNEVLSLYGEWIKYYMDVNSDPDFDFEHIEPDRKYYRLLSDFEVETIRRMAMVNLAEAFRG